jgi:hypothetical protein
MKLFPVHKDPPPIKAWNVPVSKVNFTGIIDDTWDITMKKVLPFINGVNDVKRISDLANVSLGLTKIALRHLLYYNTIEIVDIFFFSNIYACTPEITEFIESDEMVTECSNYVSKNEPGLSKYQLARYYTSFTQGRGMYEWFMIHGGPAVMAQVDVRRLVQFGVLKGFLYRVHKFAVSSQYLASLVTGQASTEVNGDSLQKYTDGLSCFDKIIVQESISDETIIRSLRTLPDVEILYR